MSTPTRTDSSAWRTFTFLNFAVAALMMAGGIWFMQASFTAIMTAATAKLIMVNVFQAEVVGVEVDMIVSCQ